MVVFCSECYRQVWLVRSTFGFSLACPCGMRRGFDYKEIQLIESRISSARGHVYYFARNCFRTYGGDYSLESDIELGRFPLS